MCDTIVVVREGHVLFAKNSDRDPNEAQLLEWHPRGEHRPGDELRCTWITIPQAPVTHAVLLSRPFWMWGAEMGANEHAVVIGNEAVFTREPYAPTGLTGMDLLRLALERASTAQAAADTIVELLERHGQGGGCGHEDRGFTYHNSFLIADPRGAIVLETAGQAWAIEPVRSGVRTISNGLTIPAFAQRHADRVRTSFSRCRVRRELTTAGGRGAGDPRALFAVLRSHGDDPWPRYSPANGAMAAPCMHAGGLIHSSQTTASWVSELGDGPARHWATATAAPCLSLFKPVSVHTPVDLAAPDDRCDERTVWWQHERLHRLAMRDPRRVGFLAERDAIEAGWLAEPPPSADAFAQEREALDRWTAALGPGADRRPWWVRRYWAQRDRRAGLVL